MNKRIDSIWFVSMVLLPILSLTLLLVFGLSGTIYSNQFTFVFSVSGVFIWCMCVAYNILFSFYTLVLKWNGFNSILKAKYLIACIVLNGLSAYVFVKFWKTEDNKWPKMSEMEHKGVMSFVFYFFTLTSLLISASIAGNSIQYN